LESIAQTREGSVKVVKVNVDESTAVATRMGIRSIPSVMLFHGGELKEMLVGARPRAVFDEMIDRVMPSA
jgi:thioredoxin-like negative regulator of GroEL